MNRYIALKELSPNIQEILKPKTQEEEMNEKISKIITKLKKTVETTVDYVAEHPIKGLIIAFVSCKIIKWLKA